MNNKPLLLAALPPLLLLAALAMALLPGTDRGQFYRAGFHNTVSANHIALAANLSPARNFAGIKRYVLDENGAFGYDLYNRFPPGGYLLMKLAMLPFSDDLSAQLYAARIVMLLFFAGAAMLAWLSLRRLTGNDWVALAAVLLAFSSYYCLYYSDMVATESWPDLFGMLLVFHGMTLFVQENRFRQLLAKTCLALLLGWHVLALLLPFVILGLARELVAPPRPLLGSLLRSRYLALGLTTLFFGGAVLGFNFANEFFALKGKTALTDLPTFHSMRYRVGLNEEFNAAHAEALAWPRYLREQFHRIGKMSLPYILSGAESMPGTGVLGGLAFCATLLGLAFVRHKILWAVLALSGFCWTLPLRNAAAFADFDALSYIGIPLALFSLTLLGLKRLAGERLGLGVAVAALLVFVASGVKNARAGFDAENIEFHKTLLADFEAMRGMTKGKAVFVPRMGYGAHMRGAWFGQFAMYYLAGSAVLFTGDLARRELADFVIKPRLWEGAPSLTPENRLAFLYDRAVHDEQIDRIMAAAGAPAIRVIQEGQAWEARLHDGKLFYAVSPQDPGAPFDIRAYNRLLEDSEIFLHVVPVDAGDLPEDRKQQGFIQLDFRFKNHILRHGKRAVAAVALPDCDIARIRTGQFVSDEGNKKLLWEAEADFRELGAGASQERPQAVP